MKIHVQPPSKTDLEMMWQEAIAMFFIITNLNADGNFDKADSYVANAIFGGQRKTASRTISRLLAKNLLLPVETGRLDAMKGKLPDIIRPASSSVQDAAQIWRKPWQKAYQNAKDAPEGDSTPHGQVTIRDHGGKSTSVTMGVIEPNPHKNDKETENEKQQRDHGGLTHGRDHKPMCSIEERKNSTVYIVDSMSSVQHAACVPVTMGGEVVTPTCNEVVTPAQSKCLGVAGESCDRESMKFKNHKGETMFMDRCRSCWERYNELEEEGAR